MRNSIKAFSLVEMLITLGIMAIVMIIASQTLNTVVKVSALTKYKTVTRTEMDFVIELMDRLLANSNIADVDIFNTTDVRYYDVQTESVVVSDEISQTLESIYSGSLEPGVSGNEVHIRPYGYSLWVCIGYFKDYEDPDNKGYMLKRTVSSLSSGHESCFDPEYTSEPILVLESDEVNVQNFTVSYTRSASNNNVFYVDAQMEPVYWVAGGSSRIERSVFRQAIITTQGLTWY